MRVYHIKLWQDLMERRRLHKEFTKKTLKNAIHLSSVLCAMLLGSVIIFYECTLLYKFLMLSCDWLDLYVPISNNGNLNLVSVLCLVLGLAQGFLLFGGCFIWCLKNLDDL